MLALVTFFLMTLSNTVAQVPQGPSGPAAMQSPLEEGPCLDSARMVPKAVASPVSRATQIIRIDQVLSTATMTPGAIIGFLYTTQDGSTWLSERTPQYMSPSDATEINQVLAATHTSTKNVTQFPPETRYGVATKYPQLFAVRIPQDAFGALRIQLAPCVAWPAGRPLPDPSM